MLFASLVSVSLAASVATAASARVPECSGTEVASQTVVAKRIVRHDLGQGVGADPSPAVVLTRGRRFGPLVARRADARVAPSRTSRGFLWPTPETSTYRCAARMAGHGDPEAQGFVDRESDVNPFGAR